LTDRPARDLQVLLALAAWYKGNHAQEELAVATRLTDSLAKNPGLAVLKGDAYLLLNGKAKAQPTDKVGNEVRLGCYEDILELINKKAFDLPPEQEYDVILEPALNLAADLFGKGKNPRLAKL
jgi:hypothetical protein